MRLVNGLGWLAASGVIVIAGVTALIYFAVERDRVQARADPEAAKWAAAYWQDPIPAQGIPPESYVEAARGLAPEDCGACHPAQFSGWKTSLHAKAMGPGVTGQFPDLHANEQAECHSCHAPLSEQYAALPSAAGLRENSDYQPALRANGLVCSACHLRKHRRHGPPLREDEQSVSEAIHGAPFRTPYFETSEYCKVCHQHPETALKVNGKPVENTYNEWLASPAASAGVTCQRCHMPDRAHEWKGIHDPEMTRSGVTIRFESAPIALRAGHAFEAKLTMENTGTGHAFPTYTTPAVYLRAALLDAGDRPLQGYYRETVLQRRLDMSTSPWREEFDTRLHPGQRAEVILRGVVPDKARALYLWVWVDPDEFYNGFFRTMLDARAEFEGREQIQAAFGETVNRRYLLWSKKLPIERGP